MCYNNSNIGSNFKLYIMQRQRLSVNLQLTPLNRYYIMHVIYIIKYKVIVTIVYDKCILIINNNGQ